MSSELQLQYETNGAPSNTTPSASANKMAETDLKNNPSINKRLELLEQRFTAPSPSTLANLQGSSLPVQFPVTTNLVTSNQVPQSQPPLQNRQDDEHMSEDEVRFLIFFSVIFEKWNKYLKIRKIKSAKKIYGNTMSVSIRN